MLQRLLLDNTITGILLLPGRTSEQPFQSKHTLFCICFSVFELREDNVEQSTSSASLRCVPRDVTQGGFVGMRPCSRLVPRCFREAVFSLVLLGAAHTHPHPASTISSKLRGAAYGVGPRRSPDVRQNRFTVKFGRQPQAGWWDPPLVHTMQRGCVR